MWKRLTDRCKVLAWQVARARVYYPAILRHSSTFTQTFQRLPPLLLCSPIMPEAGDATNDERLKAALWYSVAKTVDAVSAEQGINASPSFVAGLMEMVSTKINTVALDLEAFAQHRDSSTVSARDVVLLGRRNDGLKDALQNKAQALRKQDKL